MKSRVSFLMGLLTVFISYFAILILSYAQTNVPELANAQELIKKAFPNSKITWSKEIEGEMVNFRATSTALAIMIGNGDKRRIEFTNLQDTSEWSVHCDYNSCRYYDVIGEKESRLLIQGMQPAGPFTTLYSGKGELLFKLETDSWLYPSLNLVYFYTTANFDSHNLLKVYDAEGRFMWERGTPHGKMWFAHALSDSELIYIDYKGCFLLNALTGAEIWRIPREEYSTFVSGFLEIYPASKGKYFVVEDNYGLVSIENESEILWAKKTSMNILAASICENGRFIALYQQERGKSGVKKLELLDNFDEGKVLWSKSIETSIEDVSSDIHGLRIKGNEVSLIPGFVSYYVAKGITPQMHSFHFGIDSERGTLLEERKVEGVVESFVNEGEKLHFLVIDRGTNKGVYRIEETKAK